MKNNYYIRLQVTGSDIFTFDTVNGFEGYSDSYNTVAHTEEEAREWFDKAAAEEFKGTLTLRRVDLEEDEDETLAAVTK